MIIAVICVGAVLGVFLGAIGVIFFGVGILGGIGIYFSVTMAVTCLGVILMLRRDTQKADEMHPDWV